MALPGSRGTFHFGDFVLDVAAYDLRRRGHRVRLERQPMDLLILLVGRRGQLVPRSEIVDTLWGKDVFVDVENGVNTAIRKLRLALRDSPDAPTFIETVPGKGYRFMASVEVVPDVVAHSVTRVESREHTGGPGKTGVNRVRASVRTACMAARTHSPVPSITGDPP